MAFVVGDKVLYISGRHGASSNNPLWTGSGNVVVGRITTVDDSDSMPYTVTWDNGEFNSYNDSDLIAADVPTASEEDIPLELTLYVRSANSNGFSSYTYITLQEAMQKYETYLLRILGARRKRKSLSLPEWLHTVNIEKKSKKFVPW